jgi:CHAT domain-containing protein
MLLEPRAQARRDATFLLGDGDRLRQSGRWKEAREKWLAAAEAYRRAGDSIGLSAAYRRLGDSYTQGTDPDKGEHRVFLDYYVKGVSAATDAFEASTRKESSRDSEAQSRAEALRRKATSLSESNDCVHALPIFVEAERLYRQAGLAVEEIRSLLLRATCLTGSDADLTAMLTVVAEKLQALPQSSHDPKLVAEALFQAGRWREAREAYQKMLSRAERAKDTSGIAGAFLDMGIVQAAQGDLSAAEVSLKKSLSILSSLDGELDRNREGLARESLGRVFLEGGRLDEGVEEIHRAREIWQRFGQPDRDVVSLSRLAAGLSDNGDLAAALSAVHEAEELQRRLPDDSEAEGDLRKVKASILKAQGKFQEALGSLYQAEDFYRRGRFSLKLAAVTSDIRNLQDFLGRTKVGETSQEAPVASGQSRLMKQLEDVKRFQSLDQSGKNQEAIELCQQMIRSFMETGNRDGEALGRGLLAVSDIKTGRIEEALEELNRASLLLTPKSDPGVQKVISQVTLMTKVVQKLDSLREGRGDQGTSLREIGDLLRQGIRTQEGPGLGADRDPMLPAFKVLERLVSGDREGTFREVSETLSLFNRWGKDLTMSELKTPFFDRQFGMYAIGVELSLMTGRPEAAFRYAEEARARAFADQIANQRIDERHGANPELLREMNSLQLQLLRLKKDLGVERQKSLAEQSPERLASLQRALEKIGQSHDELRIRLKATNPEFGALVSVDPVDLSEIQHQVLDDRTTLIEYFLPIESEGPAGLVLAFVIDCEHFKMVRLPVTSGDLKNRIIELRSLIEARQPVTSQAAVLYQDLFAPLVSHIRHRNLVIVPHSLLHFLPFAALWDEKGQRYLGDAYTLSYSPSATALKFAREKKARAVGPVLAAGDPDGSLPHAAAEARAIARLYGDQPLLGRAATEGAVVARAGKAGILHLATHAVLNPVNPLFTRIELAADAEHDGNLEMGEVLGLDLTKAGLVVLSGCSTQLGKLSAGDELEGLTRAFIYAGTPAVVSSLWDVKDDSTSFLMERFYSHLRRGEGRAVALQRAQMETRHRFPHPYHWAAFVLTGDGR